jgi:large subunit ribosomal protein L23
MPAKPKRYGKHSGYTSEWKKAIVKLSADSKPLEYFESSV